MTGIAWPEHAPLRAEDLLPRLRKALAGRVASAYLFGSVAGGNARPGSDLDLILVQNTTRSFFDRGQDFFDLFDLVQTGMDLLIYTPEEFARLTSDPPPGFWRDVVKQLVRFI